MIVVLAEVEVEAANVEALKSVLAEMEQASRAEAGCHEYVFTREINDPEKVRIIELWESMDALQAHFQTPHMARFNEALAARPPRSMSLKVHELGEERALPGAGG